MADSAEAGVQLYFRSKHPADTRLQQRQPAMQTETTFQFEMSATQPNETRAQELLTDIIEAESELMHPKVEPGFYAGGLTKALAELSVETHRQIAALPKQAYFAAHYGLIVPMAPLATGNSLSSDKGNDDLTPDSASPVDSVPVYITAYRNRGAEIVYSWVIQRSKSKIDDSPIVTASVPEIDSDPSEFPDNWFVLMCMQGQPRAVVISDTLFLAFHGAVDATYQLDDLQPESDNWSVAASNKSTGYFGGRAQAFIEKLRSKKKLAVQLSESRGKRRQYSFNLEGIDGILKTLAIECGWSGILATKDEIARAQSVLRDLSYYNGGIDGRWGPISRSALIRFQKSKGLQPTGLLDEMTKAALGF